MLVDVKLKLLRVVELFEVRLLSLIIAVCVELSSLTGFDLLLIEFKVEFVWFSVTILYFESV